MNLKTQHLLDVKLTDAKPYLPATSVIRSKLATRPMEYLAYAAYFTTATQETIQEDLQQANWSARVEIYNYFSQFVNHRIKETQTLLAKLPPK